MIASNDPGQYFTVIVTYCDGCSVCVMRRFLDVAAVYSYGMELMTDPGDRVEVVPDGVAMAYDKGRVEAHADLERTELTLERLVR